MTSPLPPHLHLLEQALQMRPDHLDLDEMTLGQLAYVIGQAAGTPAGKDLSYHHHRRRQERAA